MEYKIENRRLVIEKDGVKTQIVIDVQNVKRGKNPYWIVLEAYVGRFDVNKKFPIEFCGSEAISTIPLKDDENEGLKDMLANDFGWGPYDINKIKKVLGETGISYVIER